MNVPFIPPHPPRGGGPVPVWRGFFGERARNAVYGWSEAAFRQSYMFRKVMRFRVHIPMEPAAIQHVLLENASNYVKPDIVHTLLDSIIGRGLLSSDGELWREQRKIVAASFTPPAVDALVPVFGSVARRRMERWSAGAFRDMAAESTTTTMSVISEALFGGDSRLTSRSSMDHIAAALEGFSEARLQALLGLPIMPWSPRGLKAHRGQTFLRRTLEALVRERLAEGGDDFLGEVVRALHERFPPDQALKLSVDNAATFYLAGHETTANAITWTLFLLSEQPELQEQASAEAVQAIAGDEASLPERLPLLRAILQESMRLYPPVPRFDRQAAAADRIGDREVLPGDIVSIWPWLLHRHKTLWEEPDAFDAGRFADGAPKPHRFQYLPFGGGPRLCVGARFATAEALTILACWLAAWRFSPAPGRSVRPSGMVTLRPAGGLPLRLDKRPPD
jgi:cytochrome P450